MPVADVKEDLGQLAARLQAVADALKRPARDHVLSSEEWTALCNEVRAIAAELRDVRVAR